MWGAKASPSGRITWKSYCSTSCVCCLSGGRDCIRMQCDVLGNDTLNPGLHVDVTLTHTAYLNIVADLARNLKVLLLMSWCPIPQDPFGGLVKAMPQQVRAVVAAQGAVHNIRQVLLMLWLIGVYCSQNLSIQYGCWNVTTVPNLCLPQVSWNLHDPSLIRCT